MNAPDPFSNASGQTRLDRFEGHLALITPLQIRQGIKTKFGEIDGVITKTVILTAENGPQTLDMFTILNAPVVLELKAVLAGDKSMHLARIKQVENKRGDKPIIVLDPPSEEDKELARAYLAATPKPADPFA